MTVMLSNLSYGAIWEPFFFRLNRTTCTFFSSRKRASEDTANDGEGAVVVSLSKKGLSRRLLAIYKVADGWMLFDGVHEHPLEGIVATWTRHIPFIPGLLSLATLSLRRDGVVTTITYFRPHLRDVFEDWWPLDEIDIGHNIFTMCNDPALLARFGKALK